MVLYTARKQEQDERKHQEDILLALEKAPKTFKELEGSLSFSHTTLSKHLKLLRRNGLITKIIHNEKEAYKLTEKGQSAYNEIFLLQNILTEIKEREGKYMSGGVPLIPSPKGSSEPEPLFWPSTVHLAIDNNMGKIFPLISTEYLVRIQNDLIHHMLENIQSKKLDLDDTKSGAIILGVSLNYDELVRMVKTNSYEKWNELWKKEKSIETIWVQDSITPHNKPYVLQYKFGETKK